MLLPLFLEEGHWNTTVDVSYRETHHIHCVEDIIESYRYEPVSRVQIQGR